MHKGNRKVGGLGHQKRTFTTKIKLLGMGTVASRGTAMRYSSVSDVIDFLQIEYSSENLELSHFWMWKLRPKALKYQTDRNRSVGDLCKLLPEPRPTSGLGMAWG